MTITQLLRFCYSRGVTDPPGDQAGRTAAGPATASRMVYPGGASRQVSKGAHCRAVGSSAMSRAISAAR